MAKGKPIKPLLMQEAFESGMGSISNPDQNTVPATKIDINTVATNQTSVKSGDEVRADILKDVDAILTNLDTLSKRISETVNKDFFFQENRPLNESLEGILGWVKKQANFVKGLALVKGKYKDLLSNANADIIAAKEYDAVKKLEAAIDKMKRARDEASGPKKDAIKQKAIATIKALKEKKSDLSEKFEEVKEKAKQALEDANEDLKKYEDNMPGGSEGELYTNTKKKIVNEVKLEGLREKGRIAKEKGKADAAKEAADELKKMGAKSKEADEAIKELSKDVDPKLEEDIKKIQTEIDREKDEDLAPVQSKIADIKKNLADANPEQKSKLEAELAAAKKQEDKTQEGIYYLEDYLEELKAQRAALKGEDYEKKDSKAGSTKDDTEDGGNALMKDDGKEEPKNPEIKKAQDKLASAQKALQDDEDELEEIPDTIKKVDGDIAKAEKTAAASDPPSAKDLKKADDQIKKLEDELPGLMDKLNSRNHPDVMSKKLEIAQAKLTKAELGGDTTEIEDAKADVGSAKSNYQEAVSSQEEVEEAKSSDQEAAIQVAKDEIEDLKKKKEDLKNREKELINKEIPEDQTKVDQAAKDLKAVKKGEFDEIKKKQKAKNESKELTWESLKEDLGINQKIELHESMSVSDKMKIILSR
jgi:chromosome segregation ATPase